MPYSKVGAPRDLFYMRALTLSHKLGTLRGPVYITNPLAINHSYKIKSGFSQITICPFFLYVFGLYQYFRLEMLRLIWLFKLKNMAIFPKQ